MLTIDDGTFEVGNSFVTLLTADTYFEERSSTVWVDSVSDEDKEAALIRAFDYLSVQSWAAGVFDEEVPEKIKRAQMVAAGKELSSPNVLQPDIQKNVKRQKFDGAMETEYFDKNIESGTIFTEIENLIKSYLSVVSVRTTGQRFLVRM